MSSTIKPISKIEAGTEFLWRSVFVLEKAQLDTIPLEFRCTSSLGSSWSNSRRRSSNSGSVSISSAAAADESPGGERDEVNDEPADVGDVGRRD
jgi:hypothetical protein